MKNNYLSNTFNKTSFFQALIISFIGVCFLINNNWNIFISFLVAAFCSFFYTQLLRISSYSRALALFGFPLRLLLAGIPTAILVHKLHINLIALFIGLVIGQIIYVLCLLVSIKNQNEKENKILEI